jgi:hypothetical protein
MEKEFSKCPHGLTQQCPEIANQIMMKILALHSSEDITLETIEEVNELCRNCELFEVRE